MSFAYYDSSPYTAFVSKAIFYDYILNFRAIFNSVIFQQFHDTWFYVDK